jgi:hypothetical protein
MENVKFIKSLNPRVLERSAAEAVSCKFSEKLNKNTTAPSPMADPNCSPMFESLERKTLNTLTKNIKNLIFLKKQAFSKKASKQRFFAKAYTSK